MVDANGAKQQKQGVVAWNECDRTESQSSRMLAENGLKEFTVAKFRTHEPGRIFCVAHESCFGRVTITHAWRCQRLNRFKNAPHLTHTLSGLVTDASIERKIGKDIHDGQPIAIMVGCAKYGFANKANLATAVF